jgi:hypothetical protein
MLLELARSKAESVRIRWRSVDLGSWESVNPRWRIVGGRIRIQFSNQGRLHSCWVASVRQSEWGLILQLIDAGNPLHDALEIAWQQPAIDSLDARRLWNIVRRWLSLRFPVHRIVRVVKRPELAHALSGSFLRVLFCHGGKNCVLIAADTHSEDQAHMAIGQALIWFSVLAREKSSKPVPMLYFLVPSGVSADLSHRCQFLNKSRTKTEVWEYRDRFPEEPELCKAPAPPAPEEDRDFRWPVLGPFRWSSHLERVLNLAPELIRRYPRFRDYDSLRLWGLEFGQVTGVDRDRIFFGIGPQRTELTEDNFESLRSLVEEILFYRRPDGPDPRHPYYRIQAERWLEALMLEDIPLLFPEITPESVYSQIPVYLGRESGRIDILGADRQGVLVVMELKVAADPDLPIQALDYWGRVIQHNENGDFERRGYFSEVRLTRQLPRLYLVSPVFSFHDTTESLLRYLEPDLEVWKVSINEDWRCGVKIVRRIRYTCGELK